MSAFSLCLREHQFESLHVIIVIEMCDESLKLLHIHIYTYKNLEEKADRLLSMTFQEMSTLHHIWNYYRKKKWVSIAGNRVPQSFRIPWSANCPGFTGTFACTIMNNQKVRRLIFIWRFVVQSAYDWFVSYITSGPRSFGETEKESIEDFIIKMQSMKLKMLT